MKFNIMSVIVGAAVAIALTLFPVVAHADQSRQTVAQLPPTVVDRLNLTADQQQQIEQIRQDTRTRVMALFNPEQLQQIETLMQGGQSFREAIVALNLPATQQSQLQDLLQSARQDSFGVLTPAQQQQVIEYVQEQRGGA
jgi:periplasmic protein CpxP/Spy